MQIDRIYFPVKTLGPGNRVGIWTVGCPHHCFNCSNPELWEPDSGKDLPSNTITELLIPYLKKADGITITGGEPFFQVDELFRLLSDIKKIFDKDILVYSGFDLPQLNTDDKAVHCLALIDVIITGKYVDALNDNIGLRGSSNQVITVLNKRFEKAYDNTWNCKRQSQLIINNGHLFNIGIPIKQERGNQ